MSAQPGKDTIYIDIDDEITAIIDKIRSSHERIVALVLPKRAAVFQSIVNMKLLKRTADEAKKHLVLITSEAGLLPLAGSVGIYVAKSLQSKPEIPVVSKEQTREDVEETVDMSDADAKLDPSRPIGEYSGAMGANPKDSEDDAIELDDVPAAAVASKKPKLKSRGGKRFNIPDFNKFRLWIVLGVIGLLLIIFLWYIAVVVMPRATIEVKTNSTAVNSSVDVTFDTEADAAKVDEDLIPATLQQTQKTANQQAEATGQKDKGQKASGSVTIKNCTDSPATIAAGTAVTAANLTFITQRTVALDSGNFSGGGNCKSSGGHVQSVNVTAQQSGAQYNLASRSDYKVAGNDALTVVGDEMTGGTSDIVKIVSQADIDSAKQKISTQDTTAIKTELQRALQSQGLYAVDATFNTVNPEVTTSAKVGDEAATVTVTQKSTYTMVGIKQDDLKKVIANSVSDKIDPSKQSILDYGLDEAVFKMQNQNGSTTLVSVDTTVIAGSDLNLVEIKKQIAGKKSNNAKDIIGKYPGVTEVNVRYSPFWVSNIPKNQSKITITVQKPTVQDAKKQ